MSNGSELIGRGGPRVRASEGVEVHMLVITRREGEEVVIGDPRNPMGVVRIATIKGDRVRIAFDFPRTVDVHRREIAEQIVCDSGKEAASHAPVVIPGRDEESRSRGSSAEVAAPRPGYAADHRA